METESKTRDLFLSLAALALSAASANAQSLTHVGTTQLNDNGDSFAVSVVAGDAKYKKSTGLGESTGTYGDGTLLDWRIETGTNGDNPFAGGTVTSGGGAYFDTPVCAEVVYSPQNWLKVYTAADIDVPGFGSADITSGTVPMIGSSTVPLVGNINISNLIDGQFYMVAGSYSQSATLTVTMTGPGQPTLTDTQVVSPGGNKNRLHSVEWSFTNPGGLYNNIEYQYNGGGNLGRRRYGGVLLDGTVSAGDTTPPDIADLSPADDSYSVSLTTDLVITFDETVQKGTGNIYVRTGGSPIETIDVTTGTVTLSTTNVTDDTVTIDISDLAADTDYAIQIDPGAIEDAANNDSPGIVDDTTWNFSTGAQPLPPVDSFTAVNGTTGPNAPPVLDNTFGTLELALNLGNGSGGTIDLDGITFTNNNVTSGTNTVTWATVGGISVGATTDAGAVWSTATNIVSGSPGPGSLYNNTYGTEAWSNKSGGGVFQTVNVTGLDPGKSYQIQLMHGEDRSIGNGLTYSGTLAATSGDSLAETVAFSFGDDGDNDATVFGLVTLVVSGTTNIDITYPATSGDRDPSIAGIVIHSAVGGPANPYAAWADDNAPSPQTPDDDFDGDGVSNAVEFVLGGDKDTNDLDKLPTVGASGGNMTFSFVRDQSSIDASTVVTIEVSTDLATWDTAPSPYAVPDTATAGPPVAVVDNANGTDTVTLTVAQAPDARKFARLKVAITP